SVPEVRSESPSLRPTLGEVNEEHPAAGLENSAQFRGKLSPGGSAEVMKHHRAKGQIEARVRKRERLRGGILESNLDTRPRRFRARPGQHFRRGIDAARSGRRSPLPGSRGYRSHTPHRGPPRRTVSETGREAAGAVAARALAGRDTRPHRRTPRSEVQRQRAAAATSHSLLP